METAASTLAERTLTFSDINNSRFSHRMHDNKSKKLLTPRTSNKGRMGISRQFFLGMTNCNL